MTSYNKYKNVKVNVDGIRFDSKKEAARYKDLKLLLLGGVISHLELQPQIALMCNGAKIGFYRPDFRYFDKQANATIVEDVKSKPTKTAVYNLKKRILLTQQPPIVIIEV